MSDLDAKREAEEIARWEEVEEATDLMEDGDFAGAKRLLLELSEAGSENEYVYYFLGHLYYEDELFDKALKCYTRALECKRHYLGAMIGAGQSLRMLGDTERALRMGRQVLRLQENDPDALFLVGATFFQRKEYAGALGPLKRFLETSPELEVAMEVRGMIQIAEEALGLTKN